MNSEMVEYGVILTRAPHDLVRDETTRDGDDGILQVMSGQPKPAAAQCASESSPFLEKINRDDADSTPEVWPRATRRHAPTLHTLIDVGRET